MVSIELHRFESSSAGTFGKLECLGVDFFTGELPWKGNQPHSSCIPQGHYECKFTYSPKFQRFTYLLKNVPGRDAIRIHSANFVGDKLSGMRSQVEGCIALGENTSYMDRQKFLVNSTYAVREFEKLLSGDPFMLSIYDIFSLSNPLPL